jgi:folate-binding protein YgfZ
MASEQSIGEKIDREAIILGGPQDEQCEFLQSLVTNDVAKTTAETLVYAALLTPQGKYLSDFFIRRTETGDYALDVAPSQADALAKRLTMYKLRRPITIDRASAPVAVIWGGEAPDSALPDPRDPALGWRVYTDPDTALAAAQPGDYDLHRLKLAVPESEADLIPNDTYILEAGFERLRGVDFKKGCYVGQEIVARMKHKAELRKGYALVTLSDAVKPGEPITTEENKPAGIVFSNRDGVGLALLRFDRVHSAGTLAAAKVNITPIQSKKA